MGLLILSLNTASALCYFPLYIFIFVLTWRFEPQPRSDVETKAVDPKQMKAQLYCPFQLDAECHIFFAVVHLERREQAMCEEKGLLFAGKLSRFPMKL